MSAGQTTNDYLDTELHRLLIRRANDEGVDPVLACNKARAMSPRRRTVLLSALLELQFKEGAYSFDAEHDLRGIHGIIERRSPAWRRAVRKDDECLSSGIF